MTEGPDGSVGARSFNATRCAIKAAGGLAEVPGRCDPIAISRPAGVSRAHDEMAHGE